MKVGVQFLLKEFLKSLQVENWQPSKPLLDAAQDVIDGCKEWEPYSAKERNSHLFALVSSKLRLNKERLQDFLDAGAAKRIFLNYHDKAELLDCLDYGDRDRFKRWLLQSSRSDSLTAVFNPVTPKEILDALHKQLRTGAVSRKDARDCGLHERKDEVLRSLFGSYVFHSYPTQALHKHFNADSRKTYFPSFYEHLLTFHKAALHRDCALLFLDVNNSLRGGRSGAELRDALCSFIRSAYDRLANHCSLAVLVRPFDEDGESGQWRLFSDLVLYAEKHRETALRTGYFRPEKIAAETVAHISELDATKAHFQIANEGFFFRDCIVLPRSEPIGSVPQAEGVPVDLLLMFDKNERDETVIPCPACRSFKVAGNSYPALGVRSWECQNSICPDRSAFDRGNRYSLSALIKQQAIRSDDDQIPDWSLRKWKRDVVFESTELSIIDMLIRHFSLHGDTVVLVNGPEIGSEMLGRQILAEAFNPDIELGCYAVFQNSVYFKRFAVDRHTIPQRLPEPCPDGDPEAKVFHGDCFKVLASWKESAIDGAVTSPPYYNARSYSVWPNIYCYLYDMYNSAKQVFRALKPGAVYLFNIFDYFDNENNVVFSAMGKKRMILGPYIINLFRRAGFELSGNVVWFKGEIEGKRNFNQGNKSPYYQFPFNCWEHVLVFRKPARARSTQAFPTMLDAKPVFKMIRGENVLGHSAPFPPTIPELLLKQMKPGETVLDPYSGSMTTGRAARRRGIRSISIEQHQEYCELGLRLLEHETERACMTELMLVD